MSDTPSSVPDLDAADPFNPANFAITETSLLSTAPAKKVLTTLRIGKPDKTDFVHAHPDPAMTVTAAILEFDRDAYLVPPPVVTVLDRAVYKLVTLTLCVNRQGVPFLWAVPQPAADGRTNNWHVSAREALAAAKVGWVRVVADLAAGSYTLYVAAIEMPAPVWPELTMAQLCKIAFTGRLIDGPEHIVVKKLLGQA